MIMNIDKKKLLNARMIVISLFVFSITYIVMVSLFRSCSKAEVPVVDSLQQTIDTTAMTVVADTATVQEKPITDTISKVDSSKFPDYVYSYEYVEIYNRFRPLISAIAHVESRGIPNMVSKSGKYHGLLQQSKINVDDCNEITNNSFTYEDRLNPKKSVMMFLITQKRYNKKMTDEMACRIWSRHDLSGTDPSAGEYWKKVKQEIGKRDYSHLWE